jgi:hypothetical protein
MADLIPCAHCGQPFEPSRAGHIYCKPECRYGGPLDPSRHHPLDTDAVARLFDPRRDPEEVVRGDDWYPGAGTQDGDAFAALDAHHTVAQRRSWYLGLRDRRVR